ncbi:MAG: MerR family transcriptional regulator [Pseudorhodoplanes sp.]
MDKAPDAFRTISEVADDLKVPQHVLRFWESRFNQIKPMKRAGGRRYYRPDDVDLLRGIHHLLYGEGYTIRGVQRILRDQGLKFVQQVWQPDAEQPPHGHFEDDGDIPENETDEADEVEETPRAMTPAAPRPQVGGKTPPSAAFSREDLRKLQAALFELGECRRLLDSVLPDSGVEDASGDVSH